MRPSTPVIAVLFVGAISMAHAQPNLSSLWKSLKAPRPSAAPPQPADDICAAIINLDLNPKLHKSTLASLTGESPTAAAKAAALLYRTLREVNSPTRFPKLLRKEAASKDDPNRHSYYIAKNGQAFIVKGPFTYESWADDHNIRLNFVDPPDDPRFVVLDTEKPEHRAIERALKYCYALY